MNHLPFDTRDKKPKLRSLRILMIVTAAVLAPLLWSGAQRHAAAISLVLTVFYLAVVVLLVDLFYRQIQYNPYSYNTIFYIGFALFFLAVWIMHLYVTVQQLRFPEAYPVQVVLHTLLDSAKSFILLSFPFVLLFSSAMCVSNIALIRHEGFRPVNLLGILLSFLMLGGAVFLFLFDRYVSGSQREVMMHDLAANLFAAIYLYFECMLIGAIVADCVAAFHEPAPDKDYLIVLGCGLRRDGTPCPLLRGRLDRALAFYRKQKAETGRELTFVTSGGQGPDEVISESASMKRYLMEQGIPPSRIIEEDRSTDTRENMRFSWEKIRAVDPEAKIAFSTTNYHVFRSGLYARYWKMRAVGMGAKTRWYFWPNASVREFVGLVTEHRGKQAAIFLTLVLSYTLLTLAAYRL